MERPYLYIAPSCIYLLLAVVLPAFGNTLAAQAPATDSSAQHNTIRSTADTAVKSIRRLFGGFRSQVKESVSSKLPALKKPSLKPTIAIPDSALKDIQHPFGHLLHPKPLLQFTGGYTSYNFNYRSALDTPYVEKNLVQHNLAGRLNLLLAGQLPLQVSYWIRRSNSVYFKDIADIQVSFNAAEYRNGLQNALQKRLLSLSHALKDSLSDKLYDLKNLELLKLKDIFTTLFSPQRLAEAQEIIHVKGVTYTPRLPDSSNIQREDSLRKTAALFLDRYATMKGEYDQLTHQVDSLRKILQQNADKINQYRQMVKGLGREPLSARQLQNQLDAYGLQRVEIPAKYAWLLGVRNFSLGRSTANYSELTAKNISVNGINFEYNSWYYLAVMAGTVNYRFRDFVVDGFHKTPQTIYMLRAGLGRLERNYFIVTAYRGHKQLFATGASNLTTIAITGLGAETKWRLNRTTWITAEVAKSIAPDYRNNPPEKRTEFNLTDKTNQAFAVRLYSYLPATGSGIEAFYKKAGANFQSFSSFQTNAALESWYVKAGQNLFKRKLRISASLRKNEFTNPFIVQQYTSNTVFKSVSAALRLRKWPIITAGYQPMSQLTKVDNQLIENRFQSLIATLYHLYNIRKIKTASTVMVNKFYNSSADTGFLYYNATNVYWMQNIFFNRFTANVGASVTRNPAYSLNILDASIQPQIAKLGTIGVGVKINNLNNSITKLGGYINASLRLHKQDVLYVSYDHGYLPGRGKELVSNEMATIQFIKIFKR